MKNFIYILSIGIVLFWNACSSEKTKKNASESAVDTSIAKPIFSEDSSFKFIEAQLAFGPRVPNSKGHSACANYLTQTLKKYKASVFVQEGIVTAFDGKKLNIKNIIASYNPSNPKRVLLCAHWDSRPFADQDSKDQDKAIMGANDGGSGVGVLLEMARIFSIENPKIGVDLILFDAEDYGQPEGSKFPSMQDSYCLGSQYWCKNQPSKGYQPMYGILLDMVGGENVVFHQDEISRTYAPAAVEKVWNAAAKAGYSSNFEYKNSPAIIDDHYYINTILNIPVVDLTHHDESSLTGFWTHWHTQQDNINNISKKSLKAVGQTLVEVIYSVE